MNMCSRYQMVWVEEGDHTVRRFRPLALLVFRTLTPPLELILALNP
jgi:hypothetical protein